MATILHRRTFVDVRAVRADVFVMYCRTRLESHINKACGYRAQYRRGAEITKSASSFDLLEEHESRLGPFTGR